MSVPRASRNKVADKVIGTVVALAGLLAGPAHAQSPSAQEFWREEEQRRHGGGYQNYSIPSYPPTLVEYVRPYMDKMVECRKERLRDGMEKRVKPEDFARIINGACTKEEFDYSSAWVRFANARFPGRAGQAQQAATEIIREGRNQAVAAYTDHWYSAQKAEAQKSEAQKQTPTGWTGSGFFISSAGHILTNAHVAKGCTNPTIRGAGQSPVQAAVLAIDEKNDLALMKASIRPSQVAALRVTPAAKEGEQVVVFGFPLAGMLSSAGNATFGNVSATMGLLDNPNHLQISASVQSGNSGGPLLDTSGNVIGVVVAKLGLRAAALTGDLPQNINFAIKSIVATAFLTDQGIAFEKSEKENPLPQAEVVKVAKAFSVEVKCENGSVARAPEAAQPGDWNASQRGSAAFLLAHYAAISAPNTTAVQDASRTYAEEVEYFGKRSSRADVVGQLSRFYERWPVRSYRIKDHSVNIECEGASSICTARGIVLFDAGSPQRNQHSFGEGTFEYTLKNESGSMVIIREAGTILNRRVEAMAAE